uniref:Uncharacterized protein n=1 Tax=Sphaerodactylus townsendi TaxID=933632 RepID=A0ACB8EWP5_9SAUR
METVESISYPGFPVEGGSHDPFPVEEDPDNTRFPVAEPHFSWMEPGDELQLPDPGERQELTVVKAAGSGSSSGEEEEVEDEEASCPESYLVMHKLSHRADKRSQLRVETLPDNSELASRAAEAALDKPYACTACGKTFALFATLAAHERIHMSDDDAYRCPTCGEHFPDSGKLGRHQRRHLGEERPFRCPACGKGFVLLSGLRQHRRDPPARIGISTL